jgi:hypothetical protein
MNLFLFILNIFNLNLSSAAHWGITFKLCQIIDKHLMFITQKAAMPPSHSYYLLVIAQCGVILVI